MSGFYFYNGAPYRIQTYDLLVRSQTLYSNWAKGALNYYNNTCMIFNCNKNLPLIIGNFECIHKGHLKLFHVVKNSKFNVITFKNIPRKKEQLIYSHKEKIKAIKKFKPTKIFTFDLNKNNLTAIEFINCFLKKLNSSKIIVGSDFIFGSDFKGNPIELSKHFQVEIIEVDSKYKTNAIKNLIKNQQIDKANELLSYPFHFEAKVCKGKQLGRTLGFPTANVYRDKQMINLCDGSYAGQLEYKNKVYPAAIFVRTIESSKFNQLYEAHAIDQVGLKLYHRKVVLSFDKFIRGKNKFASLDELKKQIKNDVMEIKTVL